MTGITLEVEFCPGIDIDNAILEASTLAEKLGIGWVKFKFNGAFVQVPQNADVDQGVIEYRREVSKVNGHAIVNSK